MRQLTYAVLKEGDGGILRQAPERVLQFGEGNFLRGFADDFSARLIQRIIRRSSTTAPFCFPRRQS